MSSCLPACRCHIETRTGSSVRLTPSSSTSTTSSSNEFLAVNQFTVIVGEKNRRPDILLYVNGLPLGQIECKAPGLEKPAEEAVNQVAHYRETIPTLYRYVEIVGVTDLMQAVVGTITTPAEHFAEWKTMSEADSERGRPQLELMIDGVFSPARFLELIRDFVFFETDGARIWKVLAKYHQVHAVDAAVESVAQAMNGDRPRRPRLAHTGSRQELHDGLLRQQAAGGTPG